MSKLHCPDDAIGLDISLPRLYVDCNGNAPDFRKTYRTIESKIKQEQKALKKTMKSSNETHKLACESQTSTY